MWLTERLPVHEIHRQRSFHDYRKEYITPTLKRSMFVSPVLSLSPTLAKRVYSAHSATLLPKCQAVPIPISGSTELADWESLPNAEGLWSYRGSSQRLAPSLYGTDFDGAPQLADGSQGIPANNYYNPFGVDLPFVRRRFVEIDDRGYAENIQMWRALVGLRNTVGTWHWEAAAGYSTSHAVTREAGLISTARLISGLGASGPDAAGNIVCGTPDSTGLVPAANIVSGCVPVDLFGGPGSVTPDQIAYLEVPLRDQGQNSQRMVELSAEGTWGSVLGQPVSWATGATYLREAGYYRFDPLRAGGIAGSDLPADVPGGAFDSKEFYTEARVPLLQALPAIEALELSAGVRYSRFSNFGSHAAWQSGLRWQPFALVSLRTNYGTVFRAPALAELYQAQARVLSNSTTDPCGHAPTPQQQINCAAQGVPGGSYVQDTNLGVLTLGGGNRQLSPERGTSFDAGIDLHWEGALRVKASVDFFRTALEGFISEASNNTLLEQCIDENIAAACSHIERNADGTLRRIVATEQNFGRTVARGTDFSVNLAASTPLGRVQTGGLATYLASWDKEPFEGSVPVHDAGTFDADSLQAFPHWRALGHVTWQRGPWQISYALQYIGGLTESVEVDEGFYLHRISSVTYHDIECAYEVARPGRLRPGVTNLTDRDPPFMSAVAGTDTATYRLLGRTFFADVRFRLN